MTTHDQQTEALATTPNEPEFSSTATEVPVAAQPQPPAPVQPEPSAPAQPEPRAAVQPESPADIEPPADTGLVQPKTVPSSAEVQPQDDELLFAADTSGLRSRWDDIQAAFVDDPADCVRKADDLVAEVVDQLTEAFSDARSRMEAQWARGEQASTEDLRQALQRYREFFQRLLAV